MATTTVLGKRIRFPRIPIFRVFYSLTYTLLYLVTLVFLAISPVSMIYVAFQASALQYIPMIGAGYILTAVLAVFIYSGRIYTNRSMLSGVGKAYIPIEDGEIGKTVRKMIVKQLERSAIVAWESRPRDLYGEILLAEQEGILPPETSSLDRNDYNVGTEIPVDPQNPPWGDVQHPGWSSPSQSDQNKTPDVQFDSVIAELPHLVEARAVALTPVDPNLTPVPGEARVADPVAVELLKRPRNMALREYLTQLSYYGVVPAVAGQSFLSQYERARFSGKPVQTYEFYNLMSAFSELIDGLCPINTAVVEEIRMQTAQKEHAGELGVPLLSLPLKAGRISDYSPSPPTASPYSALSGTASPVTAREGLSSRATTPYQHRNAESEESLGSVIRNSPREPDGGMQPNAANSLSDGLPSPSETLPSDSGSVLHHDPDGGND